MLTTLILFTFFQKRPKTDEETKAIFGALAEFERNLISERTRAGLEAARARGRKGAGPKKLSAEKRSLAIDLYNQKKCSIHDICRTVGISKPTLYGYIRRRNGRVPRQVQSSMTLPDAVVRADDSVKEMYNTESYNPSDILKADRAL